MIKIEYRLQKIEGKMIKMDAVQNKISGFGYISISTLYSVIMPRVL
jgi:hypothetical protein